MTVQISYAQLRANFSSGTPSLPGYVSTADLFHEIGWDDFISNPSYQNTCAIRLCLALIKTGHPLSSGSHKILAGAYKGERVEVRMRTLAEKLAQPSWFGAPRVLEDRNVSNAIGSGQGVIAYFGLPGYSGGGHIDLIDGSAGALSCGTQCYNQADDVWFWPLQRGLVS
ncbi:T6SS effector amidase Tae4 family protein [Paracoccus sp. (in: a-proteobacteria)]|uniref:T6SS effector amidase Tae4 family protein n=1 Tax=Paracoccus sp. TaxID=267 RepID=UPI003A8C496B